MADALLESFSFEEIGQHIPHKGEAIWLDRAWSGNMTANGEKFFPFDSKVFNGHFDDNPIVPGIYLIEGMAQTACFCKIPGISNKRSEILMIKNVKFRMPVKPNTAVKYEVVVKSVTSVIEFACKAYDENKTFATMEFIGMITKE